MRRGTNPVDLNNIKITLRLDISSEEDEKHRTDLDQPEWQEILAEDALRSMRMGRFRGLLKRQKLFNIAKIYSIVAQDIRMRIILHLNESDQHTLIYILKSSKLHEFANNKEECERFMILLSFEELVSVY
jgi:hypothetical protein